MLQLPTGALGLSAQGGLSATGCIGRPSWQGCCIWPPRLSNGGSAAGLTSQDLLQHADHTRIHTGAVHPPVVHAFFNFFIVVFVSFHDNFYIASCYNFVQNVPVHIFICAFYQNELSIVPCALFNPRGK